MEGEEGATVMIAGVGIWSCFGIVLLHDGVRVGCVWDFYVWKSVGHKQVMKLFLACAWVVHDHFEACLKAFMGGRGKVSWKVIFIVSSHPVLVRAL